MNQSRESGSRRGGLRVNGRKRRLASFRLRDQAVDPAEGIRLIAQTGSR